jgi:hypothetical protein
LQQTVDALDGTAVVRPSAPLAAGEHRLQAHALDRFGRRAAIIESFNVLTTDVVDGKDAVSKNPPPADERPDPVLKAPNKPPSVTLTSPSPGALIPTGSAITIAATASDSDGSITKVEFYRNGTTILGTATSAPYRTSWVNAAAGTHTLTAKAYDNKNGTATSMAITVSVVDNQLPMGAMTSPSQGAFAATGSAIELAATATDADGRVVRVEFLDGSRLVGQAVDPPFAVSWTASAPGVHALSARATDDRGGVAASQPVEIAVGAPPLVVVTQPIDCSTIDAGTTLVLTADAVSVDGSIVRVEFYDGDFVVGTSYGPPWHVTLAGLGDGAHAIRARAFDARGLSTLSRASLVTARTANQPPAVSITAPIDGAHVRSGTTVTLTATASDVDGAVTVVEYRMNGPAGSLIGRATTAPYAVSWGGATAGTYTIVAVAIDDRSRATTSSPVRITIDANTPPTIVLTSPAAGASYVAPATIALSASAADADGSIARVEFLANGAVVATTTASPHSSAWTNVGSGTYTVVARATDNGGASTTSAPSTIAVASNAAPSVVLTRPTGGTQYYAPATIELGAEASDADGTIARVDFRVNGVVRGTATVPPYRYVIDNVAAGSYAITATAVDDRGGGTTTPQTTVVVVPGPELQFAANLDASTFDDDHVLVSGYVSAPPNSAMTVNGVVVHIDDAGRFQANDVPLAPGANAVTATVSTQDGNTASRSITINSTGAGPFRVRAAPTEGLESLQVTFTIENVHGTPFKQVTFDLDDDGLSNLVARSSQFVDGSLTVTATYPVGTWIAVITVYDEQDRVVYSTRKSIVVLAPPVLEAKLRGVYDGMLQRLKAGNLAGALTAVTGSAYDRYSAIFARLQSAMPTIADRLGEIREVNFGIDLAELSVVRDSPDGARRFMIYLIRAEDGIWRIDGM